MATAAPRNAYLYLDACRTFAASFVVLSHCRDLMMVDYAPGGGPLANLFYLGTGFGHAGVIIFFVLSGFWISRSVVRRSDAPDFWRSYAIDRLSRLWIVLLPALLIGGACDLVGMRVDPFVYSGAGGSASVPHDLSGRLGLSVLVANLLFLQTLITPTFGSNAPLWSLACEFWFYLWFPALWIALRWRRPSIGLVGLVMALLFPKLLAGFAAWLVGALAFALVEGWPAATARLRRIGGRPILVAGILCLLPMLLAVRLVHVTQWGDPTPLLNLLLAVAFGCTLVGLCLVDPRPLPGITTIARYGAGSSFSLYATHFPLAMLAVTLLTQGRRMASTPHAILLVLAVAAVLILIGYLFSQATEARTPTLRAYLLRRAAGGAP